MSNITKINSDTGEIIEDASRSERQEINFDSMWRVKGDPICQDLSNEEEEVFEEVAPFAIDAKTGKLLNPSSVPMIISKGKVNVQERISSQASEADIYKILEKYAATGDASLINARECQYGDVSELPKDLNGYAQFVNSHLKALDDMNPELAKMVIDKDVKAEDIEAKAKEILQARIDDFNKNNVKEEVQE